VIGTLGVVPFIVTPRVVRTFDELKKSKAGRWAEHERLGKKPLLQYIGPGLDEVSLSLFFDSDLGLNPRKEIDRLERMEAEGKAYRLVIGGKPIGGINKWVITSLNCAYTRIDNRGTVLAGRADLTLREYVVRK